jgi:hypothetical protein
VTPEAVERRINGVFDHLATPQGRKGFCWAKNIRSPGGLREHWDQVTADARSFIANAEDKPRTVNRPEIPFDEEQYYA